MLETPRLLLREFVQSDLDAYAELIFADAEVMRYLPRRAAPPRERAERTMNFFNDHHAEYGWGPWAVVEKASGELMTAHPKTEFLPAESWRRSEKSIKQDLESGFSDALGTLRLALSRGD